MAPGLIIAAPASGHGKTVVTLGVLAFAMGRAAAPGDLGRAYEREAA